MRKIAFIFCLFLLSCSEEKADTTVLIGQITKIESLANITLGQSDTIVVTFNGGTDGCAKADHLEATTTRFTITFKAYYNYPAHATICPENIPIHQLKYVFKPTSKGTYTYQSLDSDAASATKVN